MAKKGGNLLGGFSGKPAIGLGVFILILSNSLPGNTELWATLGVAIFVYGIFTQ
jgi:hypothetical protein